MILPSSAVSFSLRPRVVTAACRSGARRIHRFSRVKGDHVLVDRKGQCLPSVSRLSLPVKYLPRSRSKRWLSVPPWAGRIPSSIMSAPSVCALRSTAFGNRRTRASALRRNRTALAAITWSMVRPACRGKRRSQRPWRAPLLRGSCRARAAQGFVGRGGDDIGIRHRSG